MYYNKLIGKIGESLACEFLKEKGYVILERNFKCIQGEIDIIAKDISKGDLVFIEVKTRRNFQYGYPAEAVNDYKQRHIYKSVKYYIYKNKVKNIPVRLDVMEIVIKDKKIFINHIIQAFDSIK